MRNYSFLNMISLEKTKFTVQGIAVIAFENIAMLMFYILLGFPVFQVLANGICMTCQSTAQELNYTNRGKTSESYSIIQTKIPRKICIGIQLT